MNSRGVLLVVATLATFLALPDGEASAQTADRPARVWASLGLGAGGVQDLDAPLALSLQVTAHWGSHHATLRALGMADGIGGSSDEISEVGILYGRRVASSFAYAAAAGGLAWVHSLSGFPRETSRTVGLPVVIEAGLQWRVFGLGIQGFGNLNTVSSFWGVALLLEIGWMP